MEIRLGDGKMGNLIGELFPSNTGGWSNYKDEYVPIMDVEGIHDVTFVGKGGAGILNLASFDLSSKVPLQLSAAYKVDNDKTMARDIQCRYNTLLDAYTEQIYEKVSSRVLSVEEEFFGFLRVGDAAAAAIAVDAMCLSAEATVKDDE